MVTSVALWTRRSTVPAMTRFSRHDTESAGYRVKRKKPHGKKRMAEWERRHAVPGATAKTELETRENQQTSHFTRLPSSRHAHDGFLHPSSQAPGHPGTRRICYGAKPRFTPGGLPPASSAARLAARSPRFPGGPSTALQRSRDPGRPVTPRHGGVSGAAPAITTTKAPSLTISRLNSAASLPAVYASRRTLPRAMQHAVPAGWLAFAGREFHPLDRDVGFQFRLTSLPPPIQSLAWRNVVPFSHGRSFSCRTVRSGSRTPRRRCSRA